jgi:hypothetical protein
MELPASGRSALEREEAKIRQWKQMRWLEIKKMLKAKNAPSSSSRKVD